MPSPDVQPPGSLGPALPTIAPRGTSAYYAAPVSEFLAATSEQVIGQLTMAGRSTPRLFLEFDVPRLGSRLDAVVVAGPIVVPIEFKCGEKHYTTAGYNQAWDYGLDLKNFHLASHAAPIFPVLVATQARSGDAVWEPPHADGVRPPRKVASAELRHAITDALQDADGPAIDADAWGRSPYQPTPTIVEAARALYSRHSVQAITRNDAGAKNLQVTSGTVEEIIERSRAHGEKAIVFVTGVPGAGKPLVGLNVATRRRDFGEARAVFLSGNGPLVAVLQEALTRDEHRRQNGAVRKGVIRQQVKPFIQNIHHFRDDGVRDPAPPGDHVVIFDEAQRAWNLEKTADFMKRRKGRAGFKQSESEFLISYLDRHQSWAVIVCLVGGGQEIHTGEAGIGAWLEAASQRFGHWRTYVSPDLSGSEYAADAAMAASAALGLTDTDKAVGVRRFRPNLRHFALTMAADQLRLARHARPARRRRRTDRIGRAHLQT